MYDQSRVLMTFVFFLGPPFIFHPPYIVHHARMLCPIVRLRIPLDSLMRISHSRRSRPLPLYYTRHVGLFLVHINYRYCPPAILLFSLLSRPALLSLSCCLAIKTVLSIYSIIFFRVFIPFIFLATLCCSFLLCFCQVMNDMRKRTSITRTTRMIS